MWGLTLTRAKPVHVYINEAIAAVLESALTETLYIHQL